MATKRRSLAKMVTWRVLATTITFVASYLITGRIDMATGIAVIEVIAKMAAYYYHERIWLVVKWGKISPESRSEEGR